VQVCTESSHSHKDYIIHSIMHHHQTLKPDLNPHSGFPKENWAPRAYKELQASGVDEEIKRKQLKAPYCRYRCLTSRDNSSYNIRISCQTATWTKFK
ncbi:hypothetical protein SK128_004341, partial [Halocaridina rubra]